MAFPALEGLDFGPALAEFQRDMFLEMIETDGAPFPVPNLLAPTILVRTTTELDR